MQEATQFKAQNDPKKISLVSFANFGGGNETQSDRQIDKNSNKGLVKSPEMPKLDPESASLGLPTIALFVSDQVRLTNNNSIPMLQVLL